MLIILNIIEVIKIASQLSCLFLAIIFIGSDKI